MSPDLTIPPDLARELFEVVREANRLAREGGTVEEREAFDEQRHALRERIEAHEAARGHSAPGIRAGLSWRCS